MLAVKASTDSVRPLLAGGSSCEIACINQPMGTVVSGKKEDIASMTKEIRQQGYKSVVLDIPFAFHSAQVDPILEDFEKVARKVRYREPQLPVLSPLLGRVIQDEGSLDGAYLARACRGVVNFRGAVEAARATSVIDEKTIWLEIGSHPACSAMIKETLGPDTVTVASLQKSTSPWKSIVPALESMYLAGLDVDWNNYHRDFPGSHHVIQLPRYGWELKNYWIIYRNDFCLTKGDAIAGQQQQKLLEDSKPTAYRYVSPSVQRVLEESHGASRSTLLVESDIFDSRLIPILRGHLVNGAALCPSVC
jgi:naphtho-gamma-pyrone polyketide synthase